MRRSGGTPGRAPPQRQEALEVAAWDGRLTEVPGMGPRRLEMVRAALNERLGRRRVRRLAPAERPPVAMILDVDREYRDKSARTSSAAPATGW